MNLGERDGSEREEWIGERGIDLRERDLLERE